MIAPWRSPAEEGFARRLSLSPLVPLAWTYAAAARGHRFAYESGVLDRRRLPCRVISVGSVSVGGAGKTPAAAWLASRLAAAGQRVALASRGYGRRGKDRVTVVSDGRRLLATLDSCGDEAMVLASHAPGVPVLVGPERSVVGWRAVAAFGSEILILDDGFQHHALHRDLEVLVVDGPTGLGNRAVLPRGPLREWASMASRADAIGVLDGQLSEADAHFLAKVAPEAVRFEAGRRPVSLRSLRGGPDFSPHTLLGMEVGAFSGLGNPQAFHRSLEALGAKVVATRCFADHHRYRKGDLKTLLRQAPVWVTTEKDAIKLRPEWCRGADLRVLRIDLEVTDEQRVLGALRSRLDADTPSQLVASDPALLASELVEECAS